MKKTILPNNSEMIEFSDGSKYWFQNGKRHRIDGPAVEWPDGSKFWYQNGKFHRIDGPAVERSDGIREWWIDGKLFVQRKRRR